MCEAYKIKGKNVENHTSSSAIWLPRRMLLLPVLFSFGFLYLVWNRLIFFSLIFYNTFHRCHRNEFRQTNARHSVESSAIEEDEQKKNTSQSLGEQWPKAMAFSHLFIVFNGFVSFWQKIRNQICTKSISVFNSFCWLAMKIILKNVHVIIYSSKNRGRFSSCYSYTEEVAVTYERVIGVILLRIQIQP